MAIQVAIHHTTKYTYDKSIKLWPQVVRLRPAPHARTKILSYSLNISPKNHFINWMQDPFGNYQARLVFPEVTDHFEVTVELIAELVSINPFDFFVDESASKYPFDYSDVMKKELLPYLEVTESGVLLEQCFQACKKYEGLNIVDFLVAINQYIYQLLDYTIRMEVGVQSCEETLTKKLGSCRDFAWLLAQIFRKFGIASRFVSGYLVQLVPDIKSVEGPSGPLEDFTDLHAWVEVFIPGAGWIGLDGTSGLFASEGHIPLSCTPHFESAAPITGATEVTKVQFEFSNTVERINETSRISLPYTTHQIENINALGHTIDQLLQAEGAHLTMGGEPTFVSIKDMESEQWNNAADGKDKRIMALDLASRLKAQFGPKGVIHFGQGKWYPGEPIPRWQYSIYWRKDGQTLWNDEKLLGDPNQKGNCTKEIAKEFTKLLTENLGIDTRYILPAYEDKYYFLWEEKNLPIDFDVHHISAEKSVIRKTLIEILENGIEEAVGYVLPIQMKYQDASWETCEWTFERKKLFLIPGNSQMGLRLPLDRLKKINATETAVIEANHFDNQKPTNQYDFILNKIEHRRSNLSTIVGKSTFWTALCVQITNGNLHVFLPPITGIDAFYDLIASIELAAAKLNIPIIIEGYQPPYDKGLIKLGVTPDPGVIEVNVHPAQTWTELNDIYDKLFDAAEKSLLGTSKYMLDGKQIGTGGGNHITLGGSTPEKSPLLLRPDVLRSMINFWQNHPSLSYLFSSNFIGPTSQAPRIDEGRQGVLYELEIAFHELEKYKNPPYWLVDRILRNLLTDITGNTHRSEFCIDKLYNPDSSTGRLGILELRGFEMPPHREMCKVQLLLVRALFTAFWKQPYKNKLVHWGTELHNKFMMKHFVQADIYEVVDYLNYQGITFDKSWLDPFLECRFPTFGKVTVNEVQLTLRSAIEPWIVLGEEMSSAGTARYVDSSVERLEVTVENFNPDRYLLLCNTIKTPLIPTEQTGKYIGSIRYKAWAPYSAMHPTIGVDSPLVFDIYDTWNERSVGGCTYHVVHPGGRSYDSYPVNELEAEGRRTTRFWEFNHTPKQDTSIVMNDGVSKSYIVPNTEIKTSLQVKTIKESADYPNVLDLRRK